jgi:glyoxalase family protein
VKRSLNQDDVSAYPFFYADKLGASGTDMTFFDWLYIGPNIRGTESISGASIRVGSQKAFNLFLPRFEEKGVKQGNMTGFAGRQLLPFEDPEGQRIYLVIDRLAAIFENFLNYERVDRAKWIDNKSNPSIFTTKNNVGLGSEV